MSSTKLTKNKRNQIIGLIVVTVLILGTLGFVLIKNQYDNIKLLTKKKEEAEAKLLVMKSALESGERVEAALNEATLALTEKELTMAAGDLYSWSINTMKRFKANYKVEIPQFGPISPPTAMNLLPRFPYKQASFNVSGKAYYHDFGRFITDFENQFPYMRVVNLNLEPDPSPAAGDREKLLFKLDVVTLVKPGNP